jgi:hypothetical protein
MRALIDSGSMVTTISETGYNNLPDVLKPDLLSLDKLGLEVTVADGSSLKYLGYIECSILVSFLADTEFFAPVLVVPDTEFTAKCPVIVGTNIIRLCRDVSSGGTGGNIPFEWQVAFDSIACNVFKVNSLNRKPFYVAPYQSAVVNGIARGVRSNISEVVTENVDGISAFSVCPRVVKINQASSSIKIPVKICNMSAKPLLIKPRSEICSIQEVKVIDSVSELPGKDRPISTPEELGLQVDRDNLSEDQLSQVRQVLGKWKHVFSSGLLDIGNTDLVKHKIELDDKRPFKLPYRKIPPGMYDEVRQHVKEMLDAGIIRV